MTAKNEITGDSIISRPSTDAFRKGWDRIFNQKNDEVIVEKDYDGCFLILVPGNRNILRLSEKHFNSLVSTILKQISAEQVSYAMKELK